MNEYRIELQDSPFNLMDLAEPKQINYLNFDRTIKEKKFNFFNNFTVLINITSNITIQKRIVYDYFTMFGDVGGLNDFICIIFGLVFRFISSTQIQKSLISKLFHISNDVDHPDG